MSELHETESCLDETEILDVLEGNLTEERRAEIEAHLDGCEARRHLIGAAAPTDPGLDDDERVLARGTSVNRYLVLTLITSLVGVGQVMVKLNQLDAAPPILDRALKLREKKGTSDPDVAEPLLALGELYLAQGTPGAAVAALERGLALNNAEYASQLELTLAEALWRLGQDHPRARALAGQARTAYERLGHRPGIDRSTRWLAEHPG